MEYLFSLLICMPNTNKVTINSLRKEMHSEAKWFFLWRSACTGKINNEKYGKQVWQSALTS